MQARYKKEAKTIKISRKIFYNFFLICGEVFNYVFLKLILKIEDFQKNIK
jgi:hypothetical protein